jgi:hypothetical protein
VTENQLGGNMAFKTIDFGKALRLAMADKGLSCVALSPLCGRTPRKISELRNTKLSVTLVTMVDIARGLDMPLSELLALGEPKHARKRS